MRSSCSNAASGRAYCDHFFAPQVERATIYQPSGDRLASSRLSIWHNVHGNCSMPDRGTRDSPTAAVGRRHASHRCGVCKRTLPGYRLIPVASIRENIAGLIAARVADWDMTGFICRSCFNRFRAEFVGAEMERDRGELSALEEEVVKSLREEQTVADDVNREFARALTIGERVADKVAEFGGSWRFILIFFGVMAVWITINSVYLLWNPFDPYPYILLNLALSLLAAVQAPVIMMSQNRQEARDRLRAEQDYEVNLKAEMEIAQLHGKMDELRERQWQELLGIQERQINMLDEQINLVRQVVATVCALPRGE